MHKYIKRYMYVYIYIYIYIYLYSFIPGRSAAERAGVRTPRHRISPIHIHTCIYRIEYRI